MDDHHTQHTVLILSPAHPTPSSSVLARQFFFRCYRNTALFFLILFSNIILLRLSKHPIKHASLTPLEANVPRLATAPKKELLPGVSVIAACANRSRNLAGALSSWRALHGLSEIILVDWSSNPPLSTNIIKSTTEQLISHHVPLRVIRVNAEPHWVLSRAYNLAARHARYRTLLKLDCDYFVSPCLLKRHTFPSKFSTSPTAAATVPFFYAGDFRAARNLEETHLNGALFVPTYLFRSVNGYDERIQRYGYDDDDLYNRLQTLTNPPAKRLNLSFDCVRHFAHADAKRVTLGSRFPDVQVQENALLVERVRASWTAQDDASTYDVVQAPSWSEHAGSVSTVVATFVPRPLRELVSSQQYAEIQMLALGRRLNADFDVPWAVIAGLDTAGGERLLSNLQRRKNERQSVCAGKKDEGLHGNECDEGTMPRLLIMRVRGGLGARLCALDSALAFARATGREPVVVWLADRQFNASFSDVFDVRASPFASLFRFEADWPIAPRAQYDSTWGKFRFYNDIVAKDGGEKIEDKVKARAHDGRAVVTDERGYSIYFESDKEMATPKETAMTTRGQRDANAELKGLPVCADIAHRAEETRGVVSARWGRVGGAHVPSGANGGGEEVTAAFTGTISGILNNGTVQQFFIVCESGVVREAVRQKVDDARVVFVKPECDDERSTACARMSMAEVLVLASSDVLLATKGSNISEAAKRLGGPKAIVVPR